MEWNKENTDKSGIVCKTNKQILRAIKFYEKLGWKDVAGFEYTAKKYLHEGLCIYWVDSSMWEPDMIRSGGSELVKGINIITPFAKPRRKFPREMLVSDDNKSWYTRTVLAKCKELYYPFIVASPPYKPEDEFQIRMRNWKYAKELPDTTELESRFLIDKIKKVEGEIKSLLESQDVSSFRELKEKNPDFDFDKCKEID